MARAAGDDGSPAAENRLQRLPLARRQGLSGARFAPLDSFFEIDRRIGGTGRRQPPDTDRDFLLRPSQMGQKDQRLAVDLFENQKARGQHPRQPSLDDFRRRFKELDGRGLQFFQRQRAMAFRGRAQQNVIDAGPGPVLGVFRDPDALGDPVGRGESDAVDLPGQRIGVLSHGLDGQIPIGLKDPNRPAGADPVAVQEKHDLADLQAFLPGGGDPLTALGANAVDGLKSSGVLADHLQYFGTEVADQLLR